MKQRIPIICTIVMMVLLVFGCGPTQTGTTGTTHQVTDGAGVAVTVPSEPKRIVPIAASTEDIVLSLVNPSRVVAVGTIPNNVPDASAKVEKHVKASAESLLSVQPDLVLVPNWVSPDAIGEMRNMQIPIYVYKTPTTVKEAKSVIHEIASLLHVSDEALIASMDADLKTVEELANKHTGPRPVVAFYSQFGLTGGKGSTFDDMCSYMKVTNAAAQLGLGAFDNGTREDLIKSNPDIIFIPSVAYTSDGTTPATAEQLYSDPALQGVKAIANRRVFLVDSSQVMSYSQFMTRAMVSMAQYIYSM